MLLKQMWVQISWLLKNSYSQFIVMYVFALQMWPEWKLFFTTAFQLLRAAGSRSYQFLCDKAHSLSRAIDQYYIPELCSMKVSKGAKIRSRYNQVPHPTQDTSLYI